MCEIEDSPLETRSLVIRDAVADDCGSIGALAIQLVHLEHSLNAGIGEPTPWAGSAAEIRKQMARPSTKFMVAEREGKIIGYARIDLHGTDRRQSRITRAVTQLVAKLSRRPRANFISAGGVITGILIAGEDRRAGVGGRLVEAAEGWLRLQGVSQVFIHVLQNNLPALQFWERNGFVPVTIVLRKPLN